jgi:hypothetical protein
MFSCVFCSKRRILRFNFIKIKNELNLETKKNLLSMVTRLLFCFKLENMKCFKKKILCRQK